MPTHIKCDVELPAGGNLQLQSVEEQEIWEATAKKYLDEFQFEKPNDLILLGTILTQQIALFRATNRMNGMIPVLDAQGIPTGQMKYEELKSSEMRAAQQTIKDATVEIRATEKALGIDKATREAGGQHTLASYLTDLKLAGRQYAVHISKRVKAYEQFAMDLRWRIRLLRNGDEEDRKYHDLSPEKLLTWCENQLAELEQSDRDFAHERGRVWLGRL